MALRRIRPLNRAAQHISCTPAGHPSRHMGRRRQRAAPARDWNHSDFGLRGGLPREYRGPESHTRCGGLLGCSRPPCSSRSSWFAGRCGPYGFLFFVNATSLPTPPRTAHSTYHHPFCRRDGHPQRKRSEQDFGEVTLRETAHLTKLVSDLSFLARSDTGSLDMAHTVFDLERSFRTSQRTWRCWLKNEM